MKIIFIGGVRIGYTVLKSVYESGYIVDTVFTLPKNSSASDYVNFESLVSKYDTKLIRATDVNKLSCVDIIQDISPDLIIVCGWQQLISKEILSIPKLGAIGFHSSLLPKYRGRAPVNWAIIMGERKTGITMFHLTESADSGDIIAQKAFPIMLNDDCNTIYKKSAKAGAELIKTHLPMIFKGCAPRIHNQSLSYPTYPRRVPKDGEIDFNRSAIDVYNYVRALTKPYPGAYYYYQNKK